MEINDIKIEYYIDYINRRLHLFNLDHERKKICDVIGNAFQHEFMTRENLLLDVMEFDWFLYEASGIIVLFKNNSYFLINPLLPYLHKEYVDRLEKKRRE